MPRNPHLSSNDILGNIFGRCEKQRYPHERAAEEAKQRREAAAAEKGEILELTVYKCDRSYCGGWHLTSNTARKRS